MKLTDEEKRAFEVVERVLLDRARIDLWAMVFRSTNEPDERWELTTHEREPYQHWHGHGGSLFEAVENLIRSKG